MVGTVQQFKIGEIVISLVFIYVMNMFPAFQRAAKMDCHHQAMLRNLEHMPVLLRPSRSLSHLFIETITGHHAYPGIAIPIYALWAFIARTFRAAFIVQCSIVLSTEAWRTVTGTSSSMPARSPATGFGKDGQPSGSAFALPPNVQEVMRTMSFKWQVPADLSVFQYLCAGRYWSSEEHSDIRHNGHYILWTHQ